MIKNHYNTDIQSFKNALNLQGTSQVRNNPPEYYGYIKYRFEQLLKNEVQKLELDDNFPQP